MSNFTCLECGRENQYCNCQPDSPSLPVDKIVMRKYSKQELLDHINAHIDNLGQCLQDSEGTIDVHDEMYMLNEFCKFIEQTLSA